MEAVLTPATLRSARESRGLSREELARRVGIHSTTIMRIEKGELDPRLTSTWLPIIRALGTLRVLPDDAAELEAEPVLCTAPGCDLRMDAPEARACTFTGCPRRVRDAA